MNDSKIDKLGVIIKACFKENFDLATKAFQEFTVDQKTNQIPITQLETGQSINYQELATICP